MKNLSRFAPHEDIARALLPESVDAMDDASHDLSHILRVWRNVLTLNAHEGGDRAVLTAATLLHDCVDVPKNSPQRPVAPRLAAEKASVILTRLGWGPGAIAEVAHAIEAHSFSANIAPTTPEAKILQDADRLDAIGLIGIARCFYVSGRMGGALYDPEDPDAAHRELDDMRYAIDHFRTKLLRLSGSFQTKTGARLAARRHQTVNAFLDGLLAEIVGDQPPCPS